MKNNNTLNEMITPSKQTFVFRNFIEYKNYLKKHTNNTINGVSLKFFIDKYVKIYNETYIIEHLEILFKGNSISVEGLQKYLKQALTQSYAFLNQDNYNNVNCWECINCNNCIECYNCITCNNCYECYNCKYCNNSYDLEKKQFNDEYKELKKLNQYNFITKI